MKRLYTGLLFAALFAIPAASAHASLNAYLQIKGSKTAKFNTAVPSGKMIVQMDEAMFHEITSPRDVATGQASGKRMHKPFTIVKEWGPATPQLKQAMDTNEAIPEMTFEVYRKAGDKQVAVYYKVTLKDCFITSITKAPSSGGDDRPMESVSFTYQKISWEKIDGKTQMADDWQKASKGSN